MYSMETTISSRCHLSAPNLPAHSPTAWKGDRDAANGEHVLDMPKAERKAEVEPHRMADDFIRKAMALVKMTGGVGRTFGRGERSMQTAMFSTPLCKAEEAVKLR